MSSENSTDMRHFSHACVQCRVKIHPAINITEFTVQQYKCPHCSHIHGYDNRNGQIKALVEKKNSPSHDRLPGTGREAVNEPGRVKLRITCSNCSFHYLADATTPVPEPFKSRCPRCGSENLSRIKQIRSQTGDKPAFSHDLRREKLPLEAAEKHSHRLEQSISGEIGYQTDYSEKTVMPRAAGKKPVAPGQNLRGLSSQIKNSLLYISESFINILRRPSESSLTGYSKRKWPARSAIAVLTVFLLTGFYGFYLLFSVSDETVQTALSNIAGRQANRILSSDGRVIGELIRSPSGSLKPADVPEKVKRAFILVEDTEFYEHNGVRWGSVFKAALENLVSFGYSRGGSTITQQLARTLLNDRTRSLERKAKEYVVAKELEAQFSKDQILTAYLNHIYLGHGVRGVNRAASFYFRKALNELNYTEALALASLPSAPERFSPLRNINLLFKKMSHHYGRDENNKPSAVEFRRQKKQLADMMKLRAPSESAFGERISLSPWVNEHIRLKIREWLGVESEYDAGLTIETTINYEMQQRAEDYTPEYLQRLSKRYTIAGNVRQKKKDRTTRALARKLSDYSPAIQLFNGALPERGGGQNMSPQAAFIAIDTRSGAVRTMLGGSRFSASNQFNRAVNMFRQTGSAIKPIIYSAAIESGRYHAVSLLDDSPLYNRENKAVTGRDYWVPDNISGVYEGMIPLMRAFAYSKNIPAIRLVQSLGIPRIKRQFTKFFFNSSEIDSRFRNDDTVAIGSLELSPLEMAVAFSAFANNGRLPRPYLISRVSDKNGKVLFERKSSEHIEFFKDRNLPARAVRSDVAHVMNFLMKKSAQFGGTGHYGHIGKTGTSNESRDLWFVGGYANIMSAAWIGFDSPGISFRGATGAGAAGPLWGAIMRRAPDKSRSYRFSSRAVSKKVCPITGTLSCEGCPDTTRALFLQGVLPDKKCSFSERKNKIASGKSEITEDDFED